MNPYLSAPFVGRGKVFCQKFGEALKKFSGVLLLGTSPPVSGWFVLLWFFGCWGLFVCLGACWLVGCFCWVVFFFLMTLQRYFKSFMHAYTCKVNVKCVLVIEREFPLVLLPRQ